MIGFSVPNERLQFDAQPVLRDMGRHTLKVLERFGAYVYTVAYRSMKSDTKAAAPPGHAPNAHEGALKRLMVFAVDRAKPSVVIGPLPFKNLDRARTLEEGGSVLARAKSGLLQTHRYRPHPFMVPAFNKGLKTVADLLQR